MRTTFLGLQHPFKVWFEGQWRQVKPYSDPEVIQFPAPYGKAHVYWFDMPEAFTLPKAFPVKSVITKFGSVPDFYNSITWALAHWLPERWLQNPGVIEFLAWGSHNTTKVTDRFSGIGVAIRSEVRGEKDGTPARACSTLVQPDTAIAAGYGTASIAQLILTGQLHKPGVWPVEEVLPTELFNQEMAVRNVKIEQTLQELSV
jgi:saccharopine dehydrogenase-like NADP-dependent oxidoreductase